MRLFLLLILSVTTGFAQADTFTQTIRGQVTDKTTNAPLPSANVIIMDSSRSLGASTDQNGRFNIENAPTGRVTLKAMYMGYTPVVLRNILVHPGKEVVLNIQMLENILKLDEISVKADLEFTPINEMATVSARQFSVEETEKYAGSRGDVARMASNYAGVAFSNDARNDIVIRGNTPSMLLWRLNGVDIPNPNHFAMEGTTGGPVGMLNNNTLNNSDFFTGAFPAEYGNAMSGVFDLSLRNGNNEQYEFLGQVGFNGFEFGAEGPFSKNSRSSFLLNYRYSTLDVMDKLGVDMGTGGVPEYQDLTLHLVFPTQNGVWDLFGLWGTSGISILDSKRDGDNLYSPGGQDLYNGSSLAVAGLSYTYFHNKNTSSRLQVSGLYQHSWTDIFDLKQSGRQRSLNDDYIESRLSLSYAFNKKHSSRLSSESGLSYDRLAVNLDGRYYDFDDERFYSYFKDRIDLEAGPGYWQAYSQWQYKFTKATVINAGLNASYFTLNSSRSLEPRIGISQSLSATDKLSLAYGLHSRRQQLLTYYFFDSEDGNPTPMNRDLDYTRAHHLVLGYDKRLSEHLRLKVEAYLQSLYDIPVERTPSSYSLINTGSEFNINLHDNMINQGTARNTGLEVTLERFLDNGLYYLFTGSLFDSRYQGSDEITRDTHFNNNFVTNVLIGKEFRLSQKHTLFFDTKIAWAGGNRYTPIDLEASRRTGDMTTIKEKAFSKQFPNYFKTDIKIGYRQSSKHITQEWMFYVENVTNHDNVLMYYFDEDTGTIKTNYQLGVFPMMQYRIYF
ncbi:MAG: carboxypeptidase-like regulatory domain-containing protein [candidate division KSB1 bacterium]|nr:carboxypeptidase-like regulatory domain-containing protein [candidate division KSB1 bacterium]